MTLTETAKRKSFSGWHALACFLGFFGLMFAVNGVFLYQAITSFPGEDVPKSYLQGLDYNSQLANRAAQAETGWQAEIGLDGDQFIFRLKDQTGAPVGGHRVTVDLKRFATTQGDTVIDLQAMGAGEYRVPVSALDSGHWQSVVTVYSATSDDVYFTAHKAIEIK